MFISISDNVSDVMRSVNMALINGHITKKEKRMLSRTIPKLVEASFEEIMKKVVDKFLVELNTQLAAKKVQLTLSHAAREWLAKKGHDPIYGARPLKRAIQREMQDPLAMRILQGEFTDGDTIRVDVDSATGKLTFDSK